MDPNETLRRLRHLTSLRGDETTPDEHALNDFTEVIELFEALDGWMSKGGFSPEDWRRRI